MDLQFSTLSTKYLKADHIIWNYFISTERLYCNYMHHIIVHANLADCIKFSQERYLFNSLSSQVWLDGATPDGRWIVIRSTFQTHAN